MSLSPSTHAPVLRRLLFPALLAVALTMAGCAPRPSQSGSGASGTDSSQTEVIATPTVPASETWDALFLQGTQVGHVRTTTRNIDENGQKLLVTEQIQQMRMARFGNTVEVQMRLKSFETADHKLLRFETSSNMGPAPMSSTGRVAGQTLEIETTTTGRKQAASIAWKPGDGGFFAIEQSMADQPMKPGEVRTVRCLLPFFNQVADCRLQARGEETVELIDARDTLLRVDATVTLADGNQIPSVLWVDRQGVVMKNRVETLGQEAIRTTKEVALGSGEAAPFNLGRATSIRLAQPIPKAHQTRQIRYRLHLKPTAEGEQQEPARSFASGATQQITPIDDHTIELTVRCIRPGPAVGPAPPAESPQAADLQPNNLIQSDDATVVAMAKEAAGEETEPWKVALALERHANQSIKEVNFSNTLATAADVARSLEGDCTEHSVLLAALARARGIPARVAIGLVYVPGKQEFGYHMWNELYLSGQWVPMDATLGQGGIGAAHIKLSHSNLSGGGSFASFLPVARVMGRLRIEVIDVQ